MSLNINGDYQITELIKRIKEEKRNTIGTSSKKCENSS